MKRNMIRWLSGIVMATLVLATARAEQDAIAEAARRMHDEALVIDTHIDTTQALKRAGWDFFASHKPPTGTGRASAGGEGTHVDYPRMREGGLDAAFFSIYMPGTVTGPPAVRRARWSSSMLCTT